MKKMIIEVGQIYKQKKHHDDRWWDKHVWFILEGKVGYSMRGDDEFQTYANICSEQYFKTKMIVPQKPFS